MPAESYDFKPNPEELSFGQLMVHIAAQNSDSCASATGTQAPASIPSSSATPPATDKQTAIKLLTISFDRCAKDLDAMPPEQLNKEVYKFRGQPVLASEALWYAFTHMAHHRGQAEVLFARKEYQAAGVAVLAFDIFGASRITGQLLRRSRRSKFRHPSPGSGPLTPVPPGDSVSPPEVTRCSSVPCCPQSPWCGG
jgi:hypothetical protein